MNLTKYAIKDVNATIHLVFYNYDHDYGGNYDNTFSIPAKVVEVEEKYIVVKDLGENPKCYKFFLHQAPNGIKSWVINPDDMGQADDVRLSISPV